MDAKKIDFMEVESGRIDTGGWEWSVGENGEGWFMGTNIQLDRRHEF